MAETVRRNHLYQRSYEACSCLDKHNHLKGISSLAVYTTLFGDMYSALVNMLASSQHRPQAGEERESCNCVTTWFEKELNEASSGSKEAPKGVIFSVFTLQQLRACSS